MRALKTLPESDSSREPTQMMMCFEGLISVLPEIISNDFCGNAVSVFFPPDLNKLLYFAIISLWYINITMVVNAVNALSMNK